MSNIALQVERLAGGNVNSGSNIIFDNVVYSSGNIIYDPLTGVITFNEAGRYVLDWWVATQTTTSPSFVVFAAVSSQGDILEGNSPIKTGEVVGVGIIDVLSAPVTVSLNYIGSGTAILGSSVPVKATLVIIQDDIVPPTGITGATGVTGATGATGATGNPGLLFNQVPATIAAFPPLNTEVVVNTLAVPVVIGQNVKIDQAISVEAITTANSDLTFIVRLYRDGVLINARTVQRTVSTAGTQRFPVANTFVDTAIATTTSAYEVRVIFTTANNVTSAIALNRNINVIRF